MSRYAVKKVYAYIKHYGVTGLVRKYIERKKDRDNYSEERLKELVCEEEFLAQKNHHFDYEPVVSIIVPVYNAPKEAFINTLRSVKNQSYGKWELCINDAGTIPVEEIVKQVFPDDMRVKYNYSEIRLGISLNSNEALKLATGDYVAFLDHDDLLTKDALFHMIKTANETRADMIYSDEDKVSEDFKEFFRPYRKPDYNHNLFLANNYICHFCMIKRELVEKAGGFKNEYDGAQDYDLFLRCMEQANRIEHISKVLYHWRVTKSSTSDNPFNKNYAHDAGKKALEDYFERNNISEVVVNETKDPGYYELSYNGKTDIMDEYELILSDNMIISEESKELLLKRAIISGGEIIAPKHIKKGKYVYNGLAKRGGEVTQSLVGKPKWYRGRFNLGITAMDICLAPNSGILVKKELIPRIKANKESFIDNRSGKFAGVTMVYEPGAKIDIKR